MGNFNKRHTIKTAKAIKTVLMVNKYRAPKKKFHCRVANPYPAVQIGGISAVAMATPGITLPLNLLLTATIPAKPPKKQ